MQLITFDAGKGLRIGVLGGDGTQVADISALAADMTAFIALGGDGLKKAADAAANADIALASVKLLAPIPEPRRNIFCVGKNYYEHAKEFHDSGFDASAGKSAIPDKPIIFTKATTSVIGPGAAIPSANDPTGSVDYEGELGVVISKRARNVSKVDAFGYVYGYTVINDVTARELQSSHKQWFLGKSLDGFCPMGPALVTIDEVGDVTQSRLTTKVNGEVRQDVSVADMIFDIPTLIETMSATMTLLPGDIIATGTPVGVGIGFDPPKFLKPNDEVEITIDKVGTLINKVK